MADVLSGGSLLVLRPDVVAAVLEDGAVLLDLETKYFYSVNPTGWAIVQLFENGATRERVETQCRAWGAPPADGDAVGGFLAALLQDRLVVAGNASASAGEVAPAQPWSPPVIEKHKEPLQRIMISAFDPTLPLAE